MAFTITELFGDAPLAQVSSPRPISRPCAPSADPTACLTAEQVTRLANTTVGLSAATGREQAGHWPTRLVLTIGGPEYRVKGSFWARSTGIVALPTGVAQA